MKVTLVAEIFLSVKIVFVGTLPGEVVVNAQADGVETVIKPVHVDIAIDEPLPL